MADPGEITYDLVDGIWCGDDIPWMTDADRADGQRVGELFAELSRTVDPDDPWSHPDADRLDRLSLNGWLRQVGAAPAVIRAREVAALSAAGGSGERVSMLSALRMDAAAGSLGDYDLAVWESQTVVEGSASVALRMAEGLGDRLRLGAPVRRIAVDGRAEVGLADGSRVSRTRWCAPCRSGRCATSPSRASRRSGWRRSGASATPVPARSWWHTARSFWRELGQNGLCESENLFGSTWPQGEGVLSILVPPERLLHHLSTADEIRRAEVLAGTRRIYDGRAADPVAYVQRDWGVDPYTLGYVTQWAPGDVMAVGPLHGTHEPPFYVAGSDHWVAGYMEGAVRTGRAAAKAILER